VERLVRCFGAPFFLGPMSFAEWEAYFQRHTGGILPASAPEAPARPVFGNKEADSFAAYRRRAG
jgi:hypothetical protein